MYSDAKQLHLIEELVKLKSEAVLMEIETLVNKTRRRKKSKKTSAHDFLGLISEQDASLMDAAIRDGCGQTNSVIR